MADLTGSAGPTLVLRRFELSAATRPAVDGNATWHFSCGLDEIVRGASPFRRALGAAILATRLASLVLD